MNADFNINGMEIQTERLVLRAFKQSDLDDFFEYASVEGVGEMAGWRHHQNKEEIQQHIENAGEYQKQERAHGIAKGPEHTAQVIVKHRCRQTQQDH